MSSPSFGSIQGATILFLSLTAACGGELEGSDGGGGSGGSGAGNTGGSGASTSDGGAGVGGTGGSASDVGGGSTQSHGPPPVDLGSAGEFVILAKSGIDTIPPSVVTGNIGVSPIDSTGITGFSLSMDASGTFSTSIQIVGVAFAADYVSPTPSDLTTAVGAMETAYTDAAGRPTPDFIDLGSGEIGGLTLVPGLYKWGTNVLITTDVTLDGGPDDVWIFQIAGGITEASNTKVFLTGGALAKNVFWQAAGAVALDTGALLEGIVLSEKETTLATGASVNGRLLSQTAVTLDASTVTQP